MQLLIVKVAKRPEIPKNVESMEGKKIKGRKRHIATDTQGHLLYVKVHAANIHDTMVGGQIFEQALAKYPTLKGACFDAGYRGEYNTHLVNLGFESYTVEEGDKVAQIVLFPVAIAEIEETDTLSESARGEGKFGSTGKK
jgi:hypothetical protein